MLTVLKKDTMTLHQPRDYFALNITTQIKLNTYDKIASQRNHPL